MELVKVKVAFVRPGKENVESRETMVAVFPDFNTRIIAAACELAIKSIISDDLLECRRWQTTVESAERLGPVWVEEKEEDQ